MESKGQNLTASDEQPSASPTSAIPTKAEALSILWQAIHPTIADAYSSLREEFNRTVKDYRLGHYENAESALVKLVAYLNDQLAKNAPETMAAGQLNALRAAANSVLGRVYEQLNRPAGAAESFQLSVSIYDEIRRRGPHEVLTPEDYRELGIALYKVGRLDEALYIFKNALQQGDKSAETHHYIGRILHQIGNLTDAETYLRTAVQLSPNDSTASIALAETLEDLGKTVESINCFMKAAFIAAQNDQWDQALRLIERCHLLNPNDTKVLSVKAEILRQDERYDEALDAIEQILRIEPQDAVALGMKGQILRTLDHYEEAVEALQQAIKQKPELPWLHAELGEALRLDEKYPEALEAFNQALKLDPQNTLAKGGRGACLVALGDYEKALTVLDELLEYDRKNAFAWAYKGEALRLNNEYEEALRALDYSLELEDEDAFALGTKGQVLRALNRNEEAVAALQKAIEIEPEGWIYAELGEALRLLRRNNEALVALDEALELDSENALVLGSKGAVLYAERRYEEALEALNKSLIVDPNYAWSCSLKGAILCELGSFEDALALFSKVTEKNDSDVFVYSLLLKGWALENLGVENVEEAKKAYERAHELDPESLWAIKGIANTLYLLNKREDAKVAYNQILERLKDLTDLDAPTMALKGWCLYRVDQYNDAMRRLVDALSLDPNIVYAQFDLALVSMESKRYSLGQREYDRALELTENEYRLRRRGLLHVAIRDLAVAIDHHPELRDVKEVVDVRDLLKREYRKADESGSSEALAN